MYDIVDRHTLNVVGHAKTLKAACRSVDRRDNSYGAYRYFHRRKLPSDIIMESIARHDAEQRAMESRS